jgi:Lysozyme like domain
MTNCQGIGGTGTLYSYAQLEGLWINAGGARPLAPVAAAIAMAESNGCSAAENPTDNNGTQTSWGLWQISNGTHGQPVPGILNPAVNAQQAVAKYKAAGGWSPWGTYTSGAYKAFLGGGTPDLNVPSAPTSAQTTAETAAAQIKSGCLASMPSVDLYVTSVGGGCIVTRAQARGAAGIAILIGGGGMALLGLILLAAYGLKSAGAGRVAGRALEVGGAVAAVAGAPEFGVPLAAAGSRVRSQGPSRAATSAAIARGKKQTGP